MMTDAEKREAVCSAMAIAYICGRSVGEGTATEGEGYSDYVRACAGLWVQLGIQPTKEGV